MSPDAAMSARFAAPVTEKLANGDVNARKAYLRSMIDVVEVGDCRVRIVGRKTTLRNVIAGKATRSNHVSGFDREWRAGEDEDENSGRWTVRLTKGSKTLSCV